MDTKGKRNQGPTKYRLTLIVKYLRASRLVGLPRFVMNVLIQHLSTINNLEKNSSANVINTCMLLFLWLILILSASRISTSLNSFFIQFIFLLMNVFLSSISWIKALCFLPIHAQDLLMWYHNFWNLHSVTAYIINLHLQQTSFTIKNTSKPLNLQVPVPTLLISICFHKTTLEPLYDILFTLFKWNLYVVKAKMCRICFCMYSRSVLC